jgi:hypothetical protein
MLLEVKQDPTSAGVPDRLAAATPLSCDIFRLRQDKTYTYMHRRLAMGAPIKIIAMQNCPENKI